MRVTKGLTNSWSNQIPLLEVDGDNTYTTGSHLCPYIVEGSTRQATPQAII
jgi:hypothetical protein